MNILDQIIAKKREKLSVIRQLASHQKERSRSRYSLKQRLQENPYLSVMAEIKRGSPSLGLFAPDLDIKAQALSYQAHGASAVSILTDEHFHGCYEDLEALAPLIRLPILAKDFIIDASQISMADSAGADVILLIAAVLTPDQIRNLTETAFSKGMEVILELHDVDEIHLAEIPKGVILGLNNRNLKTFDVSIQNGLRQIHRLKDAGAPIIAESGIQSLEQAILLGDAGFSGLLIGESLIRSGSGGNLLNDLIRIPRR